MSQVTDFLHVNIRPLCNTFFDNNAHKFDLTEAVGCGKYTEALVKHLRDQGFVKIGHLKKFGGATQYNGHAIDAFLWREGDLSLYRAIDVVANAESKPPYGDPNTTPPNRQPPAKGFGIDEPRYQDSDWMAEPSNGGQPVPTNMVPWVHYNEGGFQELKRHLAYDYARRPQGADFDVSVWAARTFHNAFMGPEPQKVPLGMDAGMARARNEWCSALGVPVVPVPSGWNIGDPVN